MPDNMEETSEDIPTEPAEKGGDYSADIPEAFQEQVKSLIEGANEHQLDYIMSCVSKCRSENSKKEFEFSDEDMPS